MVDCICIISFIHDMYDSQEQENWIGKPLWENIDRKQEWKKSKNTVRNDIISYFEKRTSVRSILERTWRYQRSDTFFADQLQQISALDVSPPNNLGNYFDPAQGIILILGSGDHIRESLQPLHVQEFDITPYKH